MTLARSFDDSSSAPMIFLRPGSLDTDLSGLSTLKLLNTDKFGKNGTTETMLKEIMMKIGECQ